MLMRFISVMLLMATALGASALKASAQSSFDDPPIAYSAELNLPYFPPGRGVVEHEVLMRRALGVLEAEFATFRTATQRLSAAADDFCDHGGDRDAVINAYKSAYLAWGPLDSYQFGPIERRGAALSVNFWPDKKNFVGKALKILLAKSAEEQRDPATIAGLSVAAQGLPAIERLLYDELPTCPAVIGISGLLEVTAQTLYADWFDAGGWADQARSAGPENAIYRTHQEFTKTLYTALDFGLTRIAEARLARPLGDHRRNFPKRAEAWRSGMSRAIIDAQLDGVGRMINQGFAGDLFDPKRSWVMRVIGQSKDRLDHIGAPLDVAVANPKTRIRVEALQTKIRFLQLQLAEDIGPGLGVDTGFSAADGD